MNMLLNITEHMRDAFKYTMSKTSLKDEKFRLTEPELTTTINPIKET